MFLNTKGMFLYWCQCIKMATICPICKIHGKSVLGHIWFSLRLCSAIEFFFPPLNGKERWRNLPTLFLSTRTLTDSVLCVLIDITLSALRKDISVSTKSEFNCRVYACVWLLIMLAEDKQFNCLFLCECFRYQGSNKSWYHKTLFVNNVG